jgi:hypothetical protein
VRLEIPRQNPRDSDGCIPRVEHLKGTREVHRHGCEVGRKLTCWQTTARGVDEEVEDLGLTGRRAPEQEAAAAEARQPRFGHCGCEATGQGRVDGVTPCAKYGYGRVRRLGVTGCHGRTARCARSLACHARERSDVAPRYRLSPVRRNAA